MERQPAEKSYVFDQGYRDVGHTFAATWGRTFEPVVNELERLGDLLSDGKFFGFLVALLGDIIVFGAITLFNIALNSLISLVLIAAFLIAVPVVYLGFALMWFADFLYRTIKRISSRCPQCQEKFDLPIYECACKRRHTRLVPSSYGIVRRTCLCGRKLPTTFFNGRHKLKAFCPHCGYDVRDGGEHADICIPVVGGPNAGKTCFVNMAISELEKRSATQNGLKFEYAFNSLNNYQDTIEAMRNHQLPDKTADMRLKYYQFYLTPPREKVKRRISLCDVGGELYKNSDQLGQQIGYRYANAFLVVIDPLSVIAYKEEVEQRIPIAQYGASAMSIDEIMSRLVSVLENFCSAKSNNMFKKNVAVVFTKCDIPGLDELIGSKAVTRCMNDRKISRLEATNEVCEKFLNRYGEQNFINSIHSKFHCVQYFTCTALGYNRNEAQFVPDGVDEPVLWIYKKIFG